MNGVYEFLLLLLFCHIWPLLFVAAHQPNCPPSFDCGYVGNFTFPFTISQRQGCGIYPIQFCDHPDKLKTVQFETNGTSFQILRVVQSLSLSSPTTFFTNVHFRDTNLFDLLQKESCDAFRNNYTLPHTFPFVSFSIQYQATMFRCNRTLHVTPPTNMYTYTNCSDYNLYYNYKQLMTGEDESPSSLRACTKLHLPIKDLPDSKSPFTFLTGDIYTRVELTKECADCHYRQGAQCQLDNTQNFYCANSIEKTSGKMLMVKRVSTAVAVGVVVLLMVLACCFARKIFQRENPTHRIIEGFLKEHGPLPTARYNYSEVKKMTNSFTNKLGQGGFGTVYKGQLHDGRVVAVKVLSESDGNGEEFINEVASISRTSHVNVVRLLGFCLDSSKRALIYEFMPNGSLDKFIYEDKTPLQVPHQLDSKVLYDIAIGIARGLEYLHRGCNTRILHFDIKPHNILLDEDFCPKISDFGLAKLCPRKESAVSIVGARGTAGYIAPEVFSRNFGVVSHKSDVYSYGMMILEMVGMKNNIKAEVNRSSDIYFPHWIYNRLESDQELGLQNIRNEIDDKMMRKMTIVGLWCIQTYPSTRPAISKVVEMLESKVELLQIPPKPCLSSTSTSLIHLSCETFSS